MSGPINYLMPFVPVIIGIIVMLLLREIKPWEAKIKLIIKDGVGDEKRLANQKSCIDASSGIGADSNSHLGAFKRMAYDELIVKGLLGDDADGRRLARAAFEKLGLLNIKDVHKLDVRLVGPKPEHLKIYAPCRVQFLSQLLSFSGQSGLLLAYLANYRLEMVT